MRIVLLSSSNNALTQRLQIELADRGHSVSTLIVDGELDDAGIERAIEHAHPQLVVAPILKRILPESIWRRWPCLIVHPGIRGDRGASSLDWAIQEGESTWGVTLLQASAEVDGGDVWAWREFPLRVGTMKTSTYRHEVSSAAVECVLEAVVAFERGGAPTPLAAFGDTLRGRLRPSMKQADRTIDWEGDDTETVLRKIRAADTAPGVIDRVLGHEVHLFGAHPEPVLRAGPAGEVFGQRHGAICRATRDGAVWITHLRPTAPRGAPRPLKLPAAQVLGGRLRWTPELPASPMRRETATWRELRYEEVGDVGCIHFDCYNGALSTEQCHRLLALIRWAKQRPTKVIVLFGGVDFFCNGIHLAEIEGAPCPAAASWDNICAIDDVVHEVIDTTSHLVVSSIGGDAAAGGMVLALAADRVYARAGVVLHPHYKALALYGSEYWTYLLPRRTGSHQAQALIDRGKPVGPRAAVVMGLIDDAWGESLADHRARVLAEAARLARDGAPLLSAKQDRRTREEQAKPLQAYRQEELARMRAIFDDPSAPYHDLRRRFLGRERERPQASGLRPQASQSGARILKSGT